MGLSMLCMAEYYRAALAIACFELNHTAPMISWDDPETREPVQRNEVNIKAQTKRRVVDREVNETGSFHGQGPELIYVSAPALAEALDVSMETARRRLSYFEEKGVLRLAVSGRPNYYEVDPEFTGVDDDNVKSENEIITVTKKLLDAAEEE